MVTKRAIKIQQTTLKPVSENKPDDQHPDYKIHLDVWERCRAAAAGQRAIKLGRDKFLPRLEGQSDTDFEAYLARANYFNATGRTVEAMIGFVSEKPMKLELPPGMEDWIEDITLTNETLDDFIESTLEQAIVVSHGGILVDMPIAEENVLTIAQAEAMALRPYLTFYLAENILNWRVGKVNNVQVLLDVWLREFYQDETSDILMQIRQLTITKEGAYNQIIWQKKEGESNFVAVRTIEPKKNGAAINQIPFFPVSKKKPSMRIESPAIESLADVNISHYINSADLENALHMSGQPTPVFTGIDMITDANGNQTAPEINVGSNTSICLPKDAKFGYLQVTGGFEGLEKAMTTKVEYMAALGARMLAQEKKQTEASETHEIKRSGENSVLAKITGCVERQVKKALEFMRDWQGLTGEVVLELNKDYLPANIPPELLKVFVAMNQAGKISDETLHEIAQYSEWLPENVNFEVEQERIASQPPPLSEPTPAPKVI